MLETGNLYGTVVDSHGASLPGTTLTLAGAGAPLIQVSNADGQFRFLELQPGTYSLEAQLEGFSTGEVPRIDIAVGRSTTVEVTLQPNIFE